MLNILKNKVYEMCTTLPHKLVDITAAGDRIEVSENSEGQPLTVSQGSNYTKTINWEYTIPSCRSTDTHAHVFIRGSFGLDNITFTDGGTGFKIRALANGRRVGEARGDTGNAGTAEMGSYSGLSLYLPITDCKIEIEVEVIADLGGTTTGNGSATASNWGVYLNVDVLTTLRMA